MDKYDQRKFHAKKLAKDLYSISGVLNDSCFN